MRICLSLLLALSLCSTTFGQVRPALGDRDPGDRPAGDREPPCGAECYEGAREARAAANDCVQDGGDREECLKKYRALVADCLENAGCEAPEPPDRDGGDRNGGDRDGGDRDGEETRCRTECSESARAAASGCLAEGGSREGCAEVYRDEVGPCLEAAGCETREDADRDRGDREPPCGLPCFETARAAVVECLENDGTREECGTAYRDGLNTCLAEAGCNEAEDPLVAGLLAAPPFLRGDSNGDGTLNLSDAVAILDRLFVGQATLGCMDAADANDDGAVNLSDPVAVLNSLFVGAGPLPEPSAERGHDPTPDDLDCLVSGA